MRRSTDHTNIQDKIQSVSVNFVLSACKVHSLSFIDDRKKVSRIMGRPRRLCSHSLRESLYVEPVFADEPPACYFPTLDRSSVVTILGQFPIGTYLVRPSSDENAAYTLSVRTEHQILNMRIYRTPQGKFHLDTGQPQQYFSDVSTLLHFYSEAGRQIRARNMKTMFKMDKALDSNTVNVGVSINAADSRGPLDSVL